MGFMARVRSSSSMAFEFFGFLGGGGGGLVGGRKEGVLIRRNREDGREGGMEGEWQFMLRRFLEGLAMDYDEIGGCSWKIVLTSPRRPLWIFSIYNAKYLA